jgi:NADH-quinone oxidoreductase subunit K
MNSIHLFDRPGAYLVIAAFLFAAGLFGLLRRRTLVGMLVSGEILFAAASLNFVTFSRFFVEDPRPGQIFVLFIMGLAAAEVAIALSIVIAVYRNYRSIRSSDLGDLKG